MFPSEPVDPLPEDKDQTATLAAGFLTNSSPLDRRKYRRLRTEMDVNVIEQKTTLEATERLLMKMQNLSEAGAFVCSPNPFPVGTIVHLEFNLSDPPVRVKVTGMVRWIDDSLTNRGMGIQFIEVETEDREALYRGMQEHVTREMTQTLTQTQVHRAILRQICKHWGETILLHDLVRITGSSQALVLRTLSDFMDFGLVVISREQVKCIKPRSEEVMNALERAGNQPSERRRVKR